VAKTKHKPSSHHLDRHAARIAADAPGAADDELLTDDQVAAWFRCSKQWLASGRSAGYGPPYERIGPMLIRYNRRKVLRWLDGRSHSSTEEYRTTRPKKQPQPARGDR
jgi:hypothetical protein